MHLDLAASVSFRGYEVIRKIEFYDQPDPKKYQRGILGNRTHLSQLTRVMEAHGRTIIPYELTKNSIIFDIQATTEILMKKYGLLQE